MDERLVITRRGGRQKIAMPLREDGSGEPYTHPAKTKDPYMKVPHAFWLEGHAMKLKLPGLALALIALSSAKHLDHLRPRRRFKVIGELPSARRCW